MVNKSLRNPFVGLVLGLAIAQLLTAGSAARAEGVAGASTGQASQTHADSKAEVNHRLAGSFQRVREGFQIFMFTAKIVGNFTIKMDANTSVEVTQLKQEGDQLSFHYNLVVKCSKWDVFASASAVDCPIPAKIEGPLAISEETCTALKAAQSVSIKMPASQDDLKAELQSQVLASLMSAEVVPVVGFNLETPFANGVEAFCPGTKAAFVERVTGISLSDDERRETIAAEITNHVLAVLKPGATNSGATN